VPERQQRVLRPVHQRLLELALRDPPGQPQVVGHVRVSHQLLRQLRVRRRQRVREVRRRRPDPPGQPSLTWWASTSRDHPYSPAAAAYQSRS